MTDEKFEQRFLEAAKEADRCRVFPEEGCIDWNGEYETAWAVGWLTAAERILEHAEREFFLYEAKDPMFGDLEEARSRLDCAALLIESRQWDAPEREAVATLSARISLLEKKLSKAFE